MKKLIISLSLLLITAVLYAQSELPSDSIQRSPTNSYKEFGGFLLDMGLLSVKTPRLPKYDFDIAKPTPDYNQLFSLNPNVSYTQGMSDIFSPSYSGFGIYGFGGFGSSTETLQMGSFKLKNGMRINTYGEYDSDGYRVKRHSALPWEKDGFKGAFEMKSANGAFGVRIEVQQGGRHPYYP